MNNSRPDSVGIVIVNWNGWQYTVAACRSLAQSAHRDFQIIIVDNASTDDSLARLRAAVPQADIIASAANAGFAGGCNIGIQRALELGCDYVFLLNNDAEVESEAISKLIEASKAHDDNAILGSVLIFADSGKYQFFGNRRGGVLDQSEYFSVTADAHLLQQDAIETEFVIGAALFLPARVLKKTGLFDERFFLNYEETDLCYRAHQLGISSFVIPSSVVRHDAHATMGPYGAPMQLYFLTRNALLFTAKHGSGRQWRETLMSRLTEFYWNVRKSWEAGVPWRKASGTITANGSATVRPPFAALTPPIGDRSPAHPSLLQRFTSTPRKYRRLRPNSVPLVMSRRDSIAAKRRLNHRK
jgi:GT2 family glycosyltransferase